VNTSEVCFLDQPPQALAARNPHKTFIRVSSWTPKQSGALHTALPPLPRRGEPAALLNNGPWHSLSHHLIGDTTPPPPRAPNCHPARYGDPEPGPLPCPVVRKRCSSRAFQSATPSPPGGEVPAVAGAPPSLAVYPDRSPLVGRIAFGRYGWNAEDLHADRQQD